VRVVPDLRIKVSPGAVEVRGEVVVPQARITLKKNAARVTPSPDVVVQGTTGDTATTRAGWSVSTDVKLTLGDDVSFEGFGLNAFIAGSVTLVDTPTQFTT